VACILPITIAALEFAAQGLTENLQPSRSVGDGATFYSESCLVDELIVAWFAFVVMLNMAIIVPGLLLLQPLRLLRYLISRRSANTPRREFRRMSTSFSVPRTVHCAGYTLTSRPARSRLPPFNRPCPYPHCSILRRCPPLYLSLTSHTNPYPPLPLIHCRPPSSRVSTRTQYRIRSCYPRSVDHSTIRMGIGSSTFDLWVDCP
jgi:hypothetical protein